MAVEFVRSDDGTRIAYEVSGSGPLLIFVNGALSTRGAGNELAALLEPHFRVLRYDRRGRGDSSDGAAYSAQREIDDLEELSTRTAAARSSTGTRRAAVSHSRLRPCSGRPR